MGYCLHLTVAPRDRLEAAQAMTLEGQRALPKCQNILTEPAQRKKSPGQTELQLLKLLYTVWEQPLSETNLGVRRLVN